MSENNKEESANVSEFIPFSPEDLEELNSHIDYIEENIIKLDTKRFDKFRMDEPLFKSGIDSVSEMCGAISALSSVGITPSMAMMYLSEREGTKLGMAHNLEISKLNSNTLIATSKYESANLQKNTL